MVANLTETAEVQAPSGMASLADVLVFLPECSTLPTQRRRDLRSAILRFSKMVELGAEAIPANINQLGILINKINHAQQDISPKTLQNIKSNLLAAVRYFLDTRKPGSPRQKLSTPWRLLFTQLPDKRIRSGLSRFFRYCSKDRIEPLQVNDNTVSEFNDELSRDSFIPGKKRRGIYRRTTRLWNEAAESVADWPDTRLTVPDQRKPRITYPLSAFPISFQEDVTAYLAWLEDKDPLADHRPPNRCKPRTIKLRCNQIQLAASALVDQGRHINDIRSLSDLVALEAAKNILRHYLKKKDDKPTSFIQNLAITLKAIAEHWVKVPADQLAALKRVKHQLGHQKFGMTEKNLRILRQFDDDHNRRLLLELPGLLMQRAASQPTAKAAITAQKAIAIEMLLMAPIRTGNLISLRFDQHLVKPGGYRGQYHLVIPEHEVKNVQPYEVRLPKQLTEYIDLYRERLLPAITGPSNQYLFPDKSIGHKSQATLSQQIKETIKKHTGLELTGHVFRHLGGKFFLEENPGQYETVRQLLGHKNIKTTVQFYTGMNTREATRVFDDVISKERDRLSAMPYQKRKPGK